MNMVDSPINEGRAVVRALGADDLTLYRIHTGNLGFVEDSIRAMGDLTLLPPLAKSYMPYPRIGRLVNFGFWIEFADAFVGLTLLCVSSWDNHHGFTTTHIAEPRRGMGFAPRTKPHLFHLGFAILGLNRIEAGCGISNSSSNRSIRKTPGFVFEGRLREYVLRTDGKYEDENRYAILRRDWLELYDSSSVSVIVD